MVSAMTASVSSMTAAGRAAGTGAANGLRSGVAPMPGIARSACSSAVAAMSGYYGAAYSAGAYIGIGLANGMASQLGRVEAIAASLANAAARATAAAAEVKSPSRVFMEIGGYIGEGLAIGMDKTQKMVARAGNDLISYGQFAVPRRASFAGGAMSVDETYGLNIEVYPTVSINVNDREIARATADEMTKEQQRKEAIKQKLRGDR